MRKITSLSDIERAFPRGNYYYGKIDIENRYSRFPQEMKAIL